MKLGFWQIQISEKDKYKTAFNAPFGQYEMERHVFWAQEYPLRISKYHEYHF